MADDPRARARARETWPIRHLSLEDEGAETLVEAQPSERFAMVRRLTLAAYAMRENEHAHYTRATMPGKMLRGFGPA